MADDGWAAEASRRLADWDAHVDRLREGVAPDGSLTYAQVVGVVNDASGPEDYVLTASGGMPGELHGGWRTGIVKHDGSSTSGATMDLEYGFSCMGYEVVAPWGAAMARAQTHPDGLVTALYGDGSYLMLNSELYSAAFAGHPYVSVLCDNSGFAVIHRLQTNQGAEGFNNMLADSRGPGADGSVHVDFAAHARSLGCIVEDVPETARGRGAAVGVRTRPQGRSRAAPPGGRGLPHPPLHLDRGGCLVGDRRARVAQRPRVVRRGKVGAAAVAVRLGVVGYGVGGRCFHTPFIEAAEGIELAGVVTRSPVATGRGRRRTGRACPSSTASRHSLASGVDAVTITTPPETRRELVLEALAAGVHVMADKPFAPTADVGRELAAAADSAGVLLSVFHNRRWDADIRTLAAVVGSGRLGELWRVHSRFDLDDPATLEAGPGGGLLRDLGSHLVDQMLWLLGDVRSVNAHLDWLDLPTGAPTPSFCIEMEHTSGVRSTGRVEQGQPHRGARAACLRQRRELPVARHRRPGPGDLRGAAAGRRPGGLGLRAARPVGCPRHRRRATSQCPRSKAATTTSTPRSPRPSAVKDPSRSRPRRGSAPSPCWTRRGSAPSSVAVSRSIGACDHLCAPRAVPLTLSSKPRKATAMTLPRTIPVGLIGAGRIGTSHAEIIARAGPGRRPRGRRGPARPEWPTPSARRWVHGAALATRGASSRPTTSRPS